MFMRNVKIRVFYTLSALVSLRGVTTDGHLAYKFHNPSWYSSAYAKSEPNQETSSIANKDTATDAGALLFKK